MSVCRSEPSLTHHINALYLFVAGPIKLYPATLPGFDPHHIHMTYTVGKERDGEIWGGGKQQRGRAWGGGQATEG